MEGDQTGLKNVGKTINMSVRGAIMEAKHGNLS
jgi:hypothetical protein